MRNLGGSAWKPGARDALVVIALALFGLLSMHGWGTHAGMDAEPSHSPPHVALVSHAHGSFDEGLHSSQVGREAPVADANVVSCQGDCDGSGSGGGLGMVGLCLTVLGGFVLGLALLLLRRCIPLLRTVFPNLRHPVLSSRDRDPPDLLRLCVIRC